MFFIQKANHWTVTTYVVLIEICDKTNPETQNCVCSSPTSQVYIFYSTFKTSIPCFAET
jgi:hypothetical protein